MDKALKRGFLFTAMGKFSNIIILLGINAVLSRLLSPKDYGIIAMMQVFITFFQLLVEAGMGPAIIQNKKISERDISSLFNFSILFSIFLALSFGLFGNFIAYFYHNKVFIVLCWIQSIAVFIGGLNVVPLAQLNKAKKFREVNMVQVFGNLVGGIVAISTALLGFGMYALILNAITIALITLLLNFYLAKIKVSKSFDSSAVKKIFSFAANQFGFNFINYFSRNSDNLLVGKFMGSAALGNYSKAYQLLMMPNSVFLGIITPVLQPVLSDFQNDTEMIKKSYLKIVHLLALVGFSLSIFLSIFSQEIIYFMFGTQWGDAIFPFKILALTVWIQLTLSPGGAVLQARNKPKALFKIGIGSAIILVLSIIVGISFKDLNKMAISLTIGFFINYFVNYFLVMKAAFDASLLELLEELMKPLLVGLITGILCFITKSITICYVNNNFFILIINGIFFGLFFVVISMIFGEIKFIKKVLVTE